MHKIRFFVFLLCVLLSMHILTLETKYEKETPIKYTHPSVKMEFKKYYEVPFTEQEQDTINEICAYYNLAPALIYKIIKVESNFNKEALSVTNDIGVMQINKKYFKSYVNEDTTLYKRYKLDSANQTDVYVNVITGCNALVYWKKHCVEQTPIHILSHYNQGFNIKSYKYAEKVLTTELKTYIKCLN